MESPNEDDLQETSTSTDMGHNENSHGDDELGNESWDNCFLCDKPMDPLKSCVIKERGIRTLIQSSIQRKDKKYLKLRTLEELTAHPTCQKMYTRESNIKSALKKSVEEWRKNRKRRQDGRSFDFSTNCFFCSKPKYSHQVCSSVKKQSTIDNVMEQLESYPKTENNKIIFSRLITLRNKDDNYYLENNVIYHKKCLSRFYQYSPQNIKGRPVSESMDDLVIFIINYILGNSKECQFSLRAIIEEYISEHGQIDIPRLDRIEHHLKKHFDDEIAVHSTGHDRIICYKRTLGKNLDDDWYSNRKTNKKEEKLKIIDLAAHIILQDIRAQKFNYDTENYNSPIDFINNVAEGIPETLKSFLDILIKTHKPPSECRPCSKWEDVIVTVAHTLMSSVRPRSLISNESETTIQTERTNESTINESEV